MLKGLGYFYGIKDAGCGVQNCCICCTGSREDLLKSCTNFLRNEKMSLSEGHTYLELCLEAEPKKEAEHSIIILPSLQIHSKRILFMFDVAPYSKA